MRAKDVMSSPVITVRPDTPVHAAAALMVSHGFTALPVVDAERTLLGIATEGDLARGRIVPDGWVVGDEPEPTVARQMTLRPLTVDPDADLADVVATMLDRGIRSVPVVAGGELVGIISSRDVLRCVARRELTSGDVRARRADARAATRSAPPR